MKKVFTMILAIAMLACVLTGCGTKAEAPAPAAAQTEAADGKTYTTTVKGNDVKFTLNADNTEVTVEVMGMQIIAAVEVNDGQMAFKGKIEGNDQIWNGFAGTTYTLNEDGTAIIVG